MCSISARDIFGRARNKILKSRIVHVTIGRDIFARDIFKVPVTIFDNVPAMLKNCP